MSEPGDVWRRRDAQRRRDEHRHQTMKAIRRDDTAWALRHIAGPDAAIDRLQAMQGLGTTWETGDIDSGPGEPRWPHRFVTTIDQLVANVASTPAGVALRVGGVDNEGDAVVEVQTDWAAGPPAVARVLGLDSPPPVDSFYVRAALLAEIGAAAATLRRVAELVADIERIR